MVSFSTLKLSVPIDNSEFRTRMYEQRDITCVTPSVAHVNNARVRLERINNGEHGMENNKIMENNTQMVNTVGKKSKNKCYSCMKSCP